MRMPFKSERQRKWMWANKPQMAKDWQAHTPKGKKLPEKKASTEVAFLEEIEKKAYGPGIALKLLKSVSRGAAKRAPTAKKMTKGVASTAYSYPEGQENR
jgi:hypothetical protein